MSKGNIIFKEGTMIVFNPYQSASSISKLKSLFDGNTKPTI